MLLTLLLKETASLNSETYGATDQKGAHLETRLEADPHVTLHCVCFP